MIFFGCAPAHIRLDEHATRLGLHRSFAQSNEFGHVIYGNDMQASDQPIHVYLDGDGSPWITRERIATDPTPQSPLVMELMALDSSPAIYIGRPCYHGLSETRPCTPLLWTHQRYSERVVASLASALKNLLAAQSATELVLIGYSGGGTLAMLLAERVSGVRQVITLAGNLAVADWTRLHGYTRLKGSLDPSNRPPLPHRIIQLHIAGGRDTNVPHRLTEPIVNRQHGAQMIIFDGYDHACCWQAIWPSVLTSIQRLQNFERRN